MIHEEIPESNQFPAVIGYDYRYGAPMSVSAEEMEPTQAVTEDLKEATAPTESTVVEPTIPMDEASEVIDGTTVSSKTVTEPIVDTTETTNEPEEKTIGSTVPANEPVVDNTVLVENGNISEQASSDAMLASTVASGTCGDNLTWTLNDEGTLTVSGTGLMEGYGVTTPPWKSHMSDITKVVIAEGVTSVGSSAFYVAENLAEISLASSIKQLGSNCFSNCDSLRYVFIPAGVQTYGDGCFSLCDSLIEIEVAADNSSLCSANGVIFNKAMTKLLQCPAGKTGDYTVPSTVREIACYAFYNCQELSRIVLPDGLESIYHHAFSMCSSLQEVVIPDSVTFQSLW